MNERIRQLSDQAYNDLVNQTGNIVVFDEDFQQRFAQLIVAECARIARNTDLEDVEGGDSAVLQAAGEQIEKHFGVES